MCNGDDSFTRISLDVAEGADFFEVLDRQLETCFLFQFPRCRMCNRLVLLNIQEPSRQGPFANICSRAGFFLGSTFDKKNFQLFSVIAEDNAVGSYCRMRVFIGVLPLFCHIFAFFLRKDSNYYFNTANKSLKKEW